MFGRSIKLFDLFGFRVGIDWSWFLIVILITWSLAASLFPQQYPDLTTSTYWVMGVVGALGLFVSIVLHELGHALVARRHGLNIRGITLFIFGGVAEMTDEPPSAKVEFLVAIGGPIVSILLAAGFYGLERGGNALGWAASMIGVLWYLGWINLILVAFNAIPAFPLDGGRVLRSILWAITDNLRWATRLTSRIGAGFGLVLILMGALSVVGGAFVAGMWWFLIGLFLRGAAHASYRQLLWRQVLRGEKVRDLMKAKPNTVSTDTPVDRFIEDYVYHHHYKMFPAMRNGDLAGCVEVEDLKGLPRDQWDQHTVSEYVHTCSDDNTIDENTDASDALRKLGRSNRSRLMVMKDGQLSGIIAMRDLIGYVTQRLEFEGEQAGEFNPAS